MGDVWDYKLRKMEIAWELASRVMPDKVTGTGKWADASYLENAQETIKQAFEAVSGVFVEDHPRSGTGLRA